MGDFAPSVEAARLNSPVPIETKPHPPGGKGVKMSLDEVALRVAKGRNDPRVRSWAIRAIHDAGVGGMHRELEQAEAVRAALKKATSYVQDPLNTEFMQAASETLCLDDKGYCFRGGDCDDLTIAYASATLSIGIPTNIVGQAFDNSGVPSHVIAAIRDSRSKEWYRVDPSTDKRVGDYVNAKQEWWIDPLDVNDKTSSTVAGAGDFVGVGMIPAARQGYTGLGQGSPATPDVAASAVAQVQSVLYDLQTACASAKAGLDQLGSITSVLGFDPEPTGYTITGLSNFPSNGTWTASMDTIVKGLLSQGLFLLSVCQQAYDGVRDIYVDATTNGIFFAGQSSDPYYWREVLATATDSIIGIYSPAGTLLYGITQALGAYLTPSQVQTQQASAGSTAGAASGSNAGSATGTQGVGALPVVEVVAITGVIIVASIATCIIYVKLLQSVISFINMAVLNKIVATAARLYPNDPDKQAAFITRSQQQQIDLANAGTKDPFGSIAQSAADIVKWLAIGGAVIGGGILLAPMIREAGESAAAAIRSRRLGVRKKVPA